MLSAFHTLGSLDVTEEESRTDLDSHADRSAVSHSAPIVRDYEHLINVSAYDPSGPIAGDLRTVSAALVVYYDPLYIKPSLPWTRATTYCRQCAFILMRSL